MKQSQRFRICLMGTGNIAEWHIQALRRVPQAEVIAVCDLSATRAESFARRWGIRDSYGSFEALREQVKPDVVHILVPPEHHFEAARQVLESGAHALLEKPMAVTSQQCDELIALAKQKGVRLGISHNFLHDESYEQLKADVQSGRLGRIDRIEIGWNREFPLVTRGPFDLWVLQSPERILLEIGPHPLGALLDLAGEPEHLTVRASEQVDLPGGRCFYRRWLIGAECGRTAVDVVISLGPGFVEHQVHVRGTQGAATADLDRNVYVRHQNTGLGHDLNRFARVRNEGRAVTSQAWRNLRRMVVGKLTRSPIGNPFAMCLSRSLSAFYRSLGQDHPDPRQSAEFGRTLVGLCERVGREAHLPPVQPATVQEVRLERKPEVLVLGATGFIGRELVRQLVEQGLGVRVLVRRPGGLDATFDRRFVEVVRGDGGRGADLDGALEGIRQVYHLAKAQAKSGRDLVKLDTELSRTVAEKCLEHRVERLIYTSTIAVYYAGGKAGTITEETPPDPRISRCSAYARAKVQTEIELLEMHRKSGLPVVIFRPGIVLGRGGSPFHPGVAHWSWDAICQYWGRGENTLPIVLVEDVAAALVAARLAAGVDGETFNLVGEPCLTARECVGEMEQISGMRFESRSVRPMQHYLGDMSKWVIKMLVRHPERYRPSYQYWESRTQQAAFDCSKARRLLGWQPESDRDTIIQRAIQEPMLDYLR